MLLQVFLKSVAFSFKWYPFDKGQWKIDRIFFKYLKGYILSRDDYKNMYLLDLRNCIDRMIYVFGSFEKKSIKNLIDISNKLKPHAFIDIGANIGVYTLSIIKETSIPEVYAFEPDSENNLKLKSNLLLNNMLGKAVVFSTALSDSDGEAELILARDQEYLNMGKSTLVQGGGGISHKEKVKTSRLDSIFKNKNITILIKMDIEGHEKFALLGMYEILTNNSVFIQIEIFPENYKDIKKSLYKLGYKLSKIQPSTQNDFYFTNITEYI